MHTFPEIKMACRRRKKVSRSSQSLQELKATNRPKKLCQWNEGRAYEALNTKKMGVNRAGCPFSFRALNFALAEGQVAPAQ